MQFDYTPKTDEEKKAIMANYYNPSKVLAQGEAHAKCRANVCHDPATSSRCTFGKAIYGPMSQPLLEAEMMLDRLVAKHGADAIADWAEGESGSCLVCGEKIEEGSDCQAEHFGNLDTPAGTILTEVK